MRVSRALLLGFCGFWVAATTVAGSKPVAISPGSPAGALIEGRCPAFSWGAVSGARAFELVVYRIGEEDGETRPVWRQELPGSALTWTPALDQCLERGGRYAWVVRATGADETPEWSPPSLFQIALGPSQAEFEAAVQLVREYLANRGGDATAGTAQPPSESESESEPETTPAAPDSRAVGTRQLTVDGGVVATSFTGDGSTLTSVTATNLDCIDCASEGELDFDPATQAELDTHAVANPTAHHAPPATLPPSGAAGGDLTGSYPNPGVTAAIARDAEILPTVLAGDGPGSGLDADTLDGQDSGSWLCSSGCNWGFEDGPTGNVRGLIPGWRVKGNAAALDHLASLKFSGALGFGADDCCNPPAEAFSLEKYFVGEFDGAAITLSVMVGGADLDNGTCTTGFEYLGEDDARIWIYAFDAGGGYLGDAYSQRASWWRANGGDVGGWANLQYSYTAPAGTRVLKVELFADDGDGTCQTAGRRASGNARIYYDDFSFASAQDWQEIALPLGAPWVSGFDGTINTSTGSSGDDVTSTAGNTLSTLSLTTKAAGRVLLIGTTSCWPTNLTSSNSEVTIKIGLAASEGSSLDGRNYLYFKYGSGIHLQTAQSGTSVYSFHVGSPGTYTYYLRAAVVSGSDTGRCSQHSLGAVFIPS